MQLRGRRIHCTRLHRITKDLWLLFISISRKRKNHSIYCSFKRTAGPVTIETQIKLTQRTIPRSTATLNEVTIYDSQLLKRLSISADSEFHNLIFISAGFWCGQLREINHMEDPGVHGKTTLKWLFKKFDETDLAQDTDKWQALMNAVMNLRVPSNPENFLTS